MIKIGLAQIPMEDLDFEKNRATHLAYIELAKDQGIHFLQFPELSLSGYCIEPPNRIQFYDQDPRLQPLYDAVKGTDLCVAVGVLTRSQVGNDSSDLTPKPYISSVLIQDKSPSLSSEVGVNPINKLVASQDQDEQYSSTYHKMHLHSGEEKYVKAGQNIKTIEFENLKIGLAICADINQPSHLRRYIHDQHQAYLAGVIITSEGYDQDVANFTANSESTLIGIANSVSKTGGWQTCGQSGFWFGGQNIAKAGPNPALVLAEKQLDHWNTRVIELDNDDCVSR